MADGDDNGRGGNEALSSGTGISSASVRTTVDFRNFPPLISMSGCSQHGAVRYLVPPPRVTRQAHLLKDIFSVRVEVFLLVEVGILDDELECSYCGHTTQDFAGVEVHMSVVPEPSTIEPSIFLLSAAAAADGTARTADA